MMTTLRPPSLPAPPVESGSTYADGMNAILYVLANDGRYCAEFELTTRQLEAAAHVAPILTARREDENPIALANITRAVSRIGDRLRRLRAMDAADAAASRARLAAMLDRLSSDDKPNAGPMAPLQPTPKPQPPQGSGLTITGPAWPQQRQQQPAPAPARPRPLADVQTITF